MRYVMVIDLNRCIGCHACSLACKVENAVGPGSHWSQVYLFEDGTFPEVRRTYLPRLCMHCEDPACVKVCPTGATYKSSEGWVLVDEDKCIGCRACAVACPYEARHMNTDESYYEKSRFPWGEVAKPHRPNTMGKCTFCEHLVSIGLNPACVDACPPGARIFGDIDDPQSAPAKLLASKPYFQLMPELNMKPSVYYLVPKYFVFGHQAA